MSVSNSFSHLTLEERRIILTGITNGSSKAAIAQTIGKDKSTIGKEIKLHRALSHKCRMPLECNNYRKCVHGRHCTPDCPEYIPFKCSAETVLPAPAMAVPAGQNATLTNSLIAPRMPIWIIEPF